MSVPAVSVVTAFFNAEPFLTEAIDSVLAQRWHDLELILVDDGSTDGSRAIAERYAAADPRIRIVAHPGNVNRGLSASRNRGIAEARAARIAFIDADDRWPPNKLAEQLSIMNRHPEISLLAGAARYWRSWSSGTDEVKPIGLVRDRVVAPPEALLTTYPLGQAEAPGTSGFLVSVEAIDRVGGFEEKFTGMYEDQAFLAKVYLREPVFFSSRCWFDYRQHDRSMLATSLRLGEYPDVRKQFLDWFSAYLKESPPVDPRVARRMRQAYQGLFLSRLRRRLSRALRRKLFTWI